MEISPTGRGLKIAINCDLKPSNDWLGFASWYSVMVNLPDAAVVIACPKGYIEDHLLGMFYWAYRLHVPVFRYKHFADLEKKGCMIIRPTVMAVRNYRKNNFGPVSVKTNEFVTFVDCENGCGRFIPSRWINRIKGPFGRAVEKLATNELTVNELKVLTLWDRFYLLYTAV